MFSMNVWKTRHYTSDHEDQPTANSQSLVQRQRRTDDQVSWVGKGVFIATQLNSTQLTQLNSVQPSQSCFCLWPTNWVNCCSRCRVEFSWVQLSWVVSLQTGLNAAQEVGDDWQSVVALCTLKGWPFPVLLPINKVTNKHKRQEQIARRGEVTKMTLWTIIRRLSLSRSSTTSAHFVRYVALGTTVLLFLLLLP